MLQKMLESKIGPLTTSEFIEILELATTDIKINRHAYSKRTSLMEAIVIVERCFSVLQKGRVA